MLSEISEISLRLNSFQTKTFTDFGNFGVLADLAGIGGYLIGGGLVGTILQGEVLLLMVNGYIVEEM